MKVKLFIAGLLLCALPVQAAPLPAYSYTDASGAMVTLDTPPNSTTVLHFWATWCAPCVKELPSVDALAARLATLSSHQWRVIAVAVGDEAATVRAFYTRHKIKNLTVNIDKNLNAMRALGVRGLPVTIIINDKSEELKRLIGDYDWATFDTQTLAVEQPKL